MIKIMTTKRYRQMVSEIESLNKEREKMIEGFESLKASYEKLNRIYQGCWEMRRSTEEQLMAMKQAKQKAEHDLNVALAKIRKYEKKEKNEESGAKKVGK